MKKLTALLACLPLLSFSALAADQLTPGDWRITVSMQMPGMPFTPPPRTIHQCITPDMAQGNLKAMVEQNQQSDCKLTEFSFNSGKGKWKIVCSGRSAGTGEGTITLDGSKHYTSETRLSMQAAGNNVMTMNSDARWTGPCKK